MPFPTGGQTESHSHGVIQAEVLLSLKSLVYAVKLAKKGLDKAAMFTSKDEDFSGRDLPENTAGFGFRC